MIKQHLKDAATGILTVFLAIPVLCIAVIIGLLIFVQESFQLWQHSGEGRP